MYEWDPYPLFVRVCGIRTGGVVHATSHEPRNSAILLQVWHVARHEEYQTEHHRMYLCVRDLQQPAPCTPVPYDAHLVASRHPVTRHVAIVRRNQKLGRSLRTPSPFPD